MTSLQARPTLRTLGAAIFLLGTILIIGVLDVVTGPSLGMSLLYLLPIGVAGWRMQRPIALVIAVAAALTWFVSDTQGGRDPLEVTLWNSVTRLVIFAAIAVLLGSLRSGQERMQSTVAELDAERARLNAFMGALRDPFVVADIEGRVTSANERAADLFGPRPLVGRRVEELMPFVSSDRPRARTVWTGRVSDPFGASVEVEVMRTPLSGRARAAAAMFVIHDITPHTELNRMREQLLYSVAHELRGPLGVLENVLDLIASEYQELSSEEFDRLAASAQRTAHRLRVLMEDLLSAGSIQAGRFTIVPEPVALREIVDDALETVQPAVSERGQRVEIDVPAGAFLVNADRRYTRQVVSNLLSNASKYGPHDTPITVQAEEEGDEVRVSVQDRGGGIPKEQLAGLFERFYRIRKDADEPGIGLGLAIVKGIVEAHGGRIGIDSEIGKGTTVWFTLPAIREAAVAI